ncbi:MAG: hypothetical protein KDD58_13765 [Bdellovibrionales bacterium]|nr:hypothetical protein [Bdellovibrionales bacterium]
MRKPIILVLVINLWGFFVFAENCETALDEEPYIEYYFNTHQEAQKQLSEIFHDQDANELVDNVEQKIEDNLNLIESLLQQVPTNHLAYCLYVELNIFNTYLILKINRTPKEKLPENIPEKEKIDKYVIREVIKPSKWDSSVKVTIHSDVNAHIKDTKYFKKSHLKKWVENSGINFAQSGLNKTVAIISLEKEVMLTFSDRKIIKKKNKEEKERELHYIFVANPYIVKSSVLDRINRKYGIDLELFHEIMSHWNHDLNHDSTEYGQQHKSRRIAIINYKGDKYRVIFNLGETEKIPAVVNIIPLKDDLGFVEFEDVN